MNPNSADSNSANSGKVKNIEVQVDDENYRLGTDFLLSLAQFTFGYMKIHPECELAITMVDNSEMERLHIEWMDLPGPTDVLSFPMDELKPNSINDGPGILGDIMISAEFAESEASKRGVSLQSEVELLLTHGILHLLGFDHLEKSEEQIMFGLQEEILDQWRKEYYAHR
jgi:probable rRNA maturation factor